MRVLVLGYVKSQFSRDVAHIYMYFNFFNQQRKFKFIFNFIFFFQYIKPKSTLCELGNNYD